MNRHHWRLRPLPVAQHATTQRDWRREREIVELAYSDYLAALKQIGNHLDTIPHCDDLVLHAPGRCEYCDHYPTWQASRTLRLIAFTGQKVGEPYGEPWPSFFTARRPCPSEVLRPIETIERWYGNVPASTA